MTKTYTKRTPDQIVADLEARIAQVRAREQRRQQRAKPEIRLGLAAAKALDKAIGAASDPSMRAAFEQARATVGSVVALPAAREVMPEKPKRGRRKVVATATV